MFPDIAAERLQSAQRREAGSGLCARGRQVARKTIMDSLQIQGNADPLRNILLSKEFYKIKNLHL